MEYYFIAKTRYKDKYEITKFSDRNEPDSLWTIIAKKYPTCDCPASRYQRTCKHLKLFKFWRENLDSQIGMMLWLEGNDIEYKLAFTFDKINTLLANS